MDYRLNAVLGSLDDAAASRLCASAQLVPLELEQVLYEPEQPIEAVYFPLSGIVSIILSNPDGRRQEVGIYGRDGFGDTALVLGRRSAPFQQLVQYTGQALRIPSADLLRESAASPQLMLALLRYVQVFNLQVAHTAFLNGNVAIDGRLARWILMCADRIDGVHLKLTHEFLSVMMSVRRASVTDAIHMLEGEQLIRAKRGSIQILDRAGLERKAGYSYGEPEREHARLIVPVAA